ncbi:MAG: 30S ribosomal protein S12 methylthiotransferase RimO [Phycisphaerae bacterium]|nr:30S ribosomal protein S12 methylthiotransferase RimO [Phycisphaerae bacterium]
MSTHGRSHRSSAGHCAPVRAGRVPEPSSLVRTSLGTDRPTTVAFVALGCAKNLVDSEKMLGQLAEAGVAITSDESDADVIVINTCGFLEASRTEGHEAIAQAVRQKTKGRCRRVVVAGCLVQRDGERLLADVPGIDALVGVHRREDVVKAVLEVGRGPRGRRSTARSEPALYLGKYHPHVDLDTARLRLTPRHYAYLRISEGCNQKCTFCTIPSIRGPLHSKPLDVILAEARELIADGALELNLIGQDTTSYGQDIGFTPGLAGLLRELDRLDGTRWIRLLYAYPSVFTDDMIAAIGECERVVKYVDIPLQHIHDRVLKAMHRRVTRAQTERLLERIRGRIPGVTIRTTFISGFPGETEAEFQELLDFVKGAGFSAVGVFPYSLEPDTPAGRMKGQLPAEEKEARANAIMEVQQQVAFAHAAAQVGRSFDVLVDGSADKGRFVGRHAGQAPEVDSVTYLTGRKLRSAQVIRVRCHRSDGYDLLARPMDDILPLLDGPR